MSSSLLSEAYADPAKNSNPNPAANNTDFFDIAFPKNYYNTSLSLQEKRSRCQLMEHLKLLDDMLSAQLPISEPCFYICERLKIASSRTLSKSRL